MKKILTSLIMLFIFCILAWGIASWYLGVRTETALRNYLEYSEKIPGEKLFRAELVEYKKSLAGAQVRFLIASDIPYIQERLGDFQIKAKVVHGPVLLHGTGLMFGSSYWNFSLNGDDEAQADTDNSNTDSELQFIFPEKLPSARVLLDFNNHANYQIKLDNLYADTQIEGRYNLLNYDNRGEINLQNLAFDQFVLFDRHVNETDVDKNNTVKNNTVKNNTVKNNIDNNDVKSINTKNGIQSGKNHSLQIRAAKASISYQHQRNITAAYKPGVTHLDIPRVELFVPFLSEKIIFSLRGDAAIQAEDTPLAIAADKAGNKEVISGLIKLSLERTLSDTAISANKIHAFPIQKADLRLEFDRLSVQGLIAISEAQAQRDNLQQQIQWTLEESSELPEGQDHIWQLYEQIKTIEEQLPQIFAHNIFNAEKSQLRLQLEATSHAQNKDSVSKLSGEIRLSDNAEHSLKYLKMLRGDASVELDSLLFEALNPWLPISSKSFNLELKEGKLLVR